MNGRIYDPELGRMLSPDPYVQVPEYSQNFNRYSYVLNNPLNKTDPTGYSWVSKAFHKIGSWVKENWRTVATIVLASALMLTGAGAFIFGFMYGLAGGTAAGIAAMSTFTLNMAVGATIGGITGAIGAALSGGNLGDVLRGAAVGAVQGAISSGPLHYLEGAKGMQLAHIAGHGVTGGAANAAMGGKFQDGFLSAAASAAAVHTGLTSTTAGTTGANIGAAGRTAASAIIGGTASALGGGKFANGAYTSAFQHLLNSESGGGWFSGRKSLSIALDLIPVVGSIKSGVELVAGYDFVGGEPVNRGLAAAGIAAGFVPGGKAALKGGAAVVKIAIKHADTGIDVGRAAAKTTPVWPKTAGEMSDFLKVEGRAIPDTLTTPGRNKTVWELGPSKITLEQHPYHPTAPDWHKDLHWHLDTPGKPHVRYLPGDPIPGY